MARIKKEERGSPRLIPFCGEKNPTEVMFIMIVTVMRLNLIYLTHLSPNPIPSVMTVDRTNLFDAFSIFSLQRVPERPLLNLPFSISFAITIASLIHLFFKKAVCSSQTSFPITILILSTRSLAIILSTLAMRLMGLPEISEFYSSFPFGN